MTVRLDVQGADGFTLMGESQMSQISRDPEDLVAQLMAHHHYPDGVALMLGTMFAPVVDRGQAGRGFTHHVGDVVRIHAGPLGTLTNDVRHCGDCEPWTFGLAALMGNLAERSLLTKHEEQQ